MASCVVRTEFALSVVFVLYDLESFHLRQTLLPVELAGFDDAALHDGDETLAVFQKRNVPDDVAVDDQHVGQFAGLERAEFVAAPHDFGAGFRRALDRFQRREADVVHEEASAPWRSRRAGSRRIRSRRPCRAGRRPCRMRRALSAPPSSVSLMAVDHPLRHAELGTVHDAGLLELQRRHAPAYCAAAAGRALRRP